MYSQDPVRRPLNTIVLLVNALNQDPGRPLLHLPDGRTATVGEVRDATSQYVQALTSLGVVEGTRVALLSRNLPEVLHATHAAQVVGAVYIPLHPMGSQPDHLHTVRDAGAELLIFEGGHYDARAAELAGEVPGLRLVALGRTELAGDPSAIWPPRCGRSHCGHRCWTPTVSRGSRTPAERRAALPCAGAGRDGVRRVPAWRRSFR